MVTYFVQCAGRWILPPDAPGRSPFSSYAEERSYSGHRGQRDGRNAGCKIEALVALDAEGLKRDRLGRPANQQIGVAADTACCAGRHAAIIAGQGAWSHVNCWRKHGPHHEAA